MLILEGNFTSYTPSKMSNFLLHSMSHASFLLHFEYIQLLRSLSHNLHSNSFINSFSFAIRLTEALRIAAFIHRSYFLTSLATFQSVSVLVQFFFAAHNFRCAYKICRSIFQSRLAFELVLCTAPALPIASSSLNAPACGTLSSVSSDLHGSHSR